MIDEWRTATEEEAAEHCTHCGRTGVVCVRGGWRRCKEHAPPEFREPEPKLWPPEWAQIGVARCSDCVGRGDTAQKSVWLTTAKARDGTNHCAQCPPDGYVLREPESEDTAAHLSAHEHFVNMQHEFLKPFNISATELMAHVAESGTFPVGFGTTKEKTMELETIRKMKEELATENLRVYGPWYKRAARFAGKSYVVIGATAGWAMAGGIAAQVLGMWVV